MNNREQLSKLLAYRTLAERINNEQPASVSVMYTWKNLSSNTLVGISREVQLTQDESIYHLHSIASFDPVTPLEASENATYQIPYSKANTLPELLSIVIIE